jgi:hypothetical protein
VEIVGCYSLIHFGHLVFSNSERDGKDKEKDYRVEVDYNL